MFSIIKNIIRTTYILVLMGFTIWYGYFLYPVIFDDGKKPDERTEEHKKLEKLFGEGTTEEDLEFLKSLKQQQQTAITDLGYMVLKEQFVQGHFHHVGMTVESDNHNVCIRCHGAVPHDRAETLRAFLNMHAFYIACESCHIRPLENEMPWEFRWYDKFTGKVVANPAGLNTTEESMYGNYSAKIAPGEIAQDGSFSLINGQNEMSFVEQYLKEQHHLDETRKSKMQKIIHRKVNEEPLVCDGCHNSQKEPYLPFAKLGYPNRRLTELTSTDVVGMTKKYQEFYIPKLLRGGGVGKE